MKHKDARQTGLQNTERTMKWSFKLDRLILRILQYFKTICKYELDTALTMDISSSKVKCIFKIFFVTVNLQIILIIK